MKTNHLVYVSLLVPTVWADSVKSWAFFAKVNDTSIPLSRAALAGFEDYLSVFAYGDPSAAPMHFNLTEDKYAYTHNQETVGFAKPLVVFGSTVTPTALQLDSENKLSNGRFYSCKLTNSRKERRIFYEMRIPYPDQCFEVDIYVLPAPKTPKVPAMTGSEVGNDVEREVEKNADLTWAFFAKENGKYMPLARNAYLEISPNVSVFSYGNISEVAKFTFQNGYAISTDTNSVDNVDSSINFFSMGPALRRTKLKLDNEMRVHNAKYYSCHKVNGRNIITEVPSSTNCFKVDLHFLRYDKKTGIAVMNSLLPQKATDMVSMENHPTNNSASVSKDLPYVFYANINGDMLALGARSAPRDGANYSQMCYGPGCDTPIEFNMIGDSAISMATGNDGFIGMHAKSFVFGPTMPRTNLMLDLNRKVCNSEYYLCGDSDKVQVITTERRYTYCFSVDIYLRNNRPEAINAVVNSSHGKAKNVVEKGENKVPWKASSEDAIVSSEKDKMALEKNESNTSSVPGDVAFYMFAVTRNYRHALTGDTFEEYGPDFSVLFFNGSRALNPVKFRLLRGNTPHTVGTPNDGYLGQLDSMFGFGHSLEERSFNIAGNGRVMNLTFFACENDEVEGFVVATTRRNDYCHIVDIFFEHP